LGYVGELYEELERFEDERARERHRKVKNSKGHGRDSGKKKKKKSRRSGKRNSSMPRDASEFNAQWPPIPTAGCSPNRPHQYHATTKKLLNFAHRNKKMSSLVLDYRFLMLYMYEQCEQLYVFVDWDGEQMRNVAPSEFLYLGNDNGEEQTGAVAGNDAANEGSESNVTDDSVGNDQNMSDHANNKSHEHHTDESSSSHRMEYSLTEAASRIGGNDIRDLLKNQSILQDSMGVEQFLPHEETIEEETLMEVLKVPQKDAKATSQTNRRETITTAEVEQDHVEASQSPSNHQTNNTRNNHIPPLNLPEHPHESSPPFQQQHPIPRNFISRSKFIHKCKMQFVEWRKQQNLYFREFFKENPNFLLYSFDVHVHQSRHRRRESKSDLSANDAPYIVCPVCDFAFVLIEMPIQIHEDRRDRETSRRSFMMSEVRRGRQASVSCQCANVYCRASFRYEMKSVPKSWIRQHVSLNYLKHSPYNRSVVNKSQQRREMTFNQLLM